MGKFKIHTYTYSSNSIKRRRQELLMSEHMDKWVAKKMREFIPYLAEKKISPFYFGL